MKGSRMPCKAGEPQTSLSRRELLVRAASGLAVAAVGTAIAGAGRFLVPPAARRAPVCAGTVAEFPAGSVRYVEAADAFVVHDESGLWGLSARCTHLGCRVQPSATGFACPCHGAAFDARGDVLRGPAVRPLPRAPVRADDEGRVWVEPGGVRG